MDIAGMLPPQQRPEHTEDREGFFHLMRFDGSVEETTLQYIIREHDHNKFEWQKSLLRQAVDFAAAKYGKDVITSYSIHYTKLYEEYPDLKRIRRRRTAAAWLPQG